MSNWKHKILVIWMGQSVSLLTSSILQMAIIWYITATTGSALLLACATLAGFMPQALLGSFTGPLIDRVAKKRILIGADLGLACTSLVLAAVALTGDLPIWLIMVILVLRSLGTAFHEPAAHALTPLIVPKDNLAQYAGYSQAFDSICQLLSPSIALMLYGVWDLSWIMALDTIGAAFAITILLFIKFPKEVFAPRPAEKISIIADTKLGLNYLKTQEGIIPLLILAMVYSMIYSPVGSLYPHMTMIYFGGSTVQSGIVEVLFSSGALLGSLVLGRVAGKLSKLKGMFCSIFLYGLGIFVCGWLAPEGYEIFAVLSFFIGMTIPFYHGITRAIYQIAIPQEYLGRTFAISQSCKRLGMPVGLLCGSLFADSVGINYMYIIAGSLAVILSVFVIKLSSLKRFRNL
ncbi:MAG: MFS transporter [Eubacteriales bacterium]